MARRQSHQVPITNMAEHVRKLVNDQSTVRLKGDNHTLKDRGFERGDGDRLITKICRDLHVDHLELSGDDTITTIVRKVETIKSGQQLQAVVGPSFLEDSFATRLL